MIENQSDNIDDKENDISDQENVPVDSQISEDPTIDNDESVSYTHLTLPTIFRV